MKVAGRVRVELVDEVGAKDPSDHHRAAAVWSRGARPELPRIGILVLWAHTRSSRRHELVDLRAAAPAVKAFLESLGVHVMMSEEVDFPDDGHGLASPYVSCLDTLETFQLVVVARVFSFKAFVSASSARAVHSAW